MCGIVGAFSFGKPDTDKEWEKIRQEAIIFMTTELLQQTQTRGEDATGIATLFDNGMYIGLKSGDKAVNFISTKGGKETDYQGYLKIWRNKVASSRHQRYSRIHIGHCRKSSVGNSTNNDNNHPIVVDPIIGIHNGTLKNHEIIFKKLDCERTGDVDSEAIIRLVHFYTKGGKLPFTVDMMEEVGNRLDGSFATIIANANNPYQVTLMKDLRPIELLLIRPLKLVLVASESKFFDVMLFRYNKYLSLYNMNAAMPQLKKDDIQTKGLINDDVLVFDLTKEIDADTKLMDLYDEGRLSFNNKKWKAAYTTKTYYGSNRTYNNKTGAAAGSTVKTGNVDKKTTNTTTGTNNKTPIGKVWNKHTGGFKETATAGSTQKKGNVAVNVKSGGTTKLEKVSNAEREMVNGTTTIHVDAAGVKEEAKSKTTPATKKTHTDVVVVKEVDMTVNSKAVDIARKFSRNVKLYEDDEEIVADLELASTNVLTNIPVIALANRIKKFIYKIGVYDGYCAKEEEIIDDGTIRPNLKDRKREKNIRILKTMTKTLGSIIDNLCHEDSVDEQLKKMPKPEELTASNVERIINDGDVRDSIVLKKMLAWSADKDGDKKK